jgi:cobalt-zinc-cadmium efflux system protein
MKTEKRILIAFLLNLCFSVFEFVGGVITGSVAIWSDALHDFGDALGIGMSWLLERKSKQQPDDSHTYGYARYSVLGSLITTVILLLGSVAVIGRGVDRILHPVPVDHKGMILFALVGVLTNGLAAYMTREGDSLNRKAVNLHMLEDVLGWAVVLLGAIVMGFTDLTVLDPILSMAVAAFILFHAVRNLKQVLELFLAKTPKGIRVQEIKAHLLKLNGIQDVHHIHLWSMDAQRSYATMHIVTDGEAHTVKARVREELREHGIVHATLELETPQEECHERHCHTAPPEKPHHHHH